MKAIGIPLASVLFVSLAAAPAHAKRFSTAIYAVIDQVTFESSGTSPDAVRISGVFVVPCVFDAPPFEHCVEAYKEPQRGYLYFQLPQKQAENARKEWESLKVAAGTGRVVDFADFWAPNPNDPSGNPHTVLRVIVHAQNAVAPPVFYPSSNGVRTFPIAVTLSEIFTQLISAPHAR